MEKWIERPAMLMADIRHFDPGGPPANATNRRQRKSRRNELRRLIPFRRGKSLGLFALAGRFGRGGSLGRRLFADDLARLDPGDDFLGEAGRLALEH